MGHVESGVETRRGKDGVACRGPPNTTATARLPKAKLEQVIESEEAVEGAADYGRRGKSAMMWSWIVGSGNNELRARGQEGINVPLHAVALGRKTRSLRRQDV